MYTFYSLHVWHFLVIEISWVYKHVLLSLHYSLKKILHYISDLRNHVLSFSSFLSIWKTFLFSVLQYVMLRGKVFGKFEGKNVTLQYFWFREAQVEVYWLYFGIIKNVLILNFKFAKIRIFNKILTVFWNLNIEYS